MENLFQLNGKRIAALAVVFAVTIFFASAVIRADEVSSVTADGGYTVADVTDEGIKSSAKSAADKLLPGSDVGTAKVLAVLDIGQGTASASGEYEIRLSNLKDITDKDNSFTVRVLRYSGSQWDSMPITAVSSGKVSFKTQTFASFAVVRLTMAKSSVVDADLVGAYNVDSKNFVSQTIKNATDKLLGESMNKLNADKLKPTGVADVKVAIVSGDDKDNIVDNGIKPIIKKAVENRAKVLNGGTSSNQVDAADIAGVYYFNLTASQTGDVTFKMEDEVEATDGYAFVIHYTGIASDEDGITVQYVKIGSSGKVTAHFNSFSPVGIVATRCTNAQTLANTFSYTSGSDDPTATTATAPTTTPGAVVTPNAPTTAGTTIPSTTTTGTTTGTTVTPTTTTTGTTTTGTTTTGTTTTSGTVTPTTTPGTLVSQGTDAAAAQGTTAVQGTTATPTAGTTVTPVVPTTTATAQDAAAAAQAQANAAAAAPAETAQPAQSSAVYYPAYEGETYSIVDALKAIGEKNASKAHRSRIAGANGITGYRGSSKQNLSLLRLLKDGVLIKVDW